MLPDSASDTSRRGPAAADIGAGASGTTASLQSLRAWAIQDALDAALTETGAEVADVYLRHPGDDAVTLVGVRGPCAEAFTQIMRFEDGHGYPGIVAGGGRPLSLSDGVHDVRVLRSHVKEAGFRFFLCVPIPGPDRPLGSLNVASRSGSESLLERCLTLSRAAERLSLILERAGNVDASAEARSRSDAAVRLSLYTLGPFNAKQGPMPLPLDCFARRRALTLLKILVTNYGKVVARDELSELLWPSDPPKDAAKLLKIAVHYLRRGLGEPETAKAHTSFISTEPNGYAFNAGSSHTLDALEFTSTAERGFHFERQGRWREALVALRSAAELYRGDYLEDEPYSDWCVKRRRQLRETLFDVLLTSARLLRVAGDHEAAIRYYRRILDLDPCMEEVHRDLMSALCRCGQRAQALRQFEICRQALRDEFDVAPVVETEALYRSIRAQFAKRDAEPKRNRGILA